MIIARRRFRGEFSEEQLFGVVDSIYGAATVAGEWAPVMERIARITGADRALMFTPSREAARQLWASHEIQPEMMAGYGEHYADEDLWTREVYRRKLPRPGALLMGEELVSNRELLRSRFFNEFLRPIDIRSFAGVFIESADGKGHSDLTLSLFGGCSHPGFNSRTFALLGAIAPHIRRALHTQWALSEPAAEATASAALDTLAAAVIVCDANARVLHLNRAADQLLNDEHTLHVRNGRLLASNPAQQCRLDVAIRSAAVKSGGQGDTLELRSETQDQTSLLIICPAANGDGPVQRHAPAAVIVVHHDTGRMGRTGELLQKCFGLSPAEVRVVEALQGGGTLSEIAVELGVAHSTVRSQLRSIFEKTGARRQTDLIRFVLGLQVC